jgi:hypothetical protein
MIRRKAQFAFAQRSGMTGKRFEELRETEFETLIDGYIERTASGYGEIPVEHFLTLLTERIAAKTEETVNLSIDVSDDDHLRITPDREWSDIVIRGNEIWVGNRKLVLKLTERD